MFPDFIGIGAQRTGSTWLTRNLQAHPEIWMTPIKEIHYFDIKERGLLAGPLERFQSTKWPHKGIKRILASRLLKKTRNFHLDQWKWDYNFFFREQNDQWYASLFEQGAGYCAGENTPSYAVLKEETVADIHRLMPDTKIIFMMRDPIDRAWSQAVKEFVRHKKRALDSVTDDEWVKCFSHPRVTTRSDYVRTLDIWSRYYSEDQIFTGFFEDVIENPAELILKIYKFLGVDSSEKSVPVDLRKVVNAGYKCSIPPKWEDYLVQQYREQIVQAHERIGGRSVDWMRRIDR